MNPIYDDSLTAVSPLANVQDGSSPTGCMMMERVLQDMFKQVFAVLKANTDPLGDLFYKLDAASLTDIKQWYANSVISVRLGYPDIDKGIRLPLIAIITEQEAEMGPEDFLGDEMGQVQLSDDQASFSHVVGQTEQCTYNIMCYAAGDSNAVLWLSYVVKGILMLNRMFLAQQGAIDPTISCRDVSFREDMLPEAPYTRLVALTCKQHFSLRISEATAASLVVTTLVDGVGGVELDLSPSTDNS